MTNEMKALAKTAPAPGLDMIRAPVPEIGPDDVLIRVKKTGIVICQYPSGIQFTEDDDDVAKLVIGIAAKNDEHIQVITTITNALDEPEAIEKLTSTNDVEEILNILGCQQAA